MAGSRFVGLAETRLGPSIATASGHQSGQRENSSSLSEIQRKWYHQWFDLLQRTWWNTRITSVKFQKVTFPWKSDDEHLSV